MSTSADDEEGVALHRVTGATAAARREVFDLAARVGRTAAAVAV